MKNSDRELDEKFLTSGQESIRLEIALKRFFELDMTDEKLYVRYLEYLTKRFHPAMEKLMAAGKKPQAEILFSKVEITEIQLEKLLESAMNSHSTESILWLLEEKKKRFGFGGKDMEL